MKKKVIKRKSHHFTTKNGSLYIIDWGYNDFKYVEGVKSKRYVDHYSLHFVVSGKGTLMYGDKVLSVGEKEVFCLMPEVEFGYYPDGSDPWRYFWINFAGDECADLISSMDFSKTNPVKKATLCETVFASMENLLLSKYSQKEFYYKVKSILYDAVSVLCSDKSSDAFIKTSNVVTRVKNILLLNYKNPDFSVDVLSEIMHVSHSYVCRLFKQSTGQTVVKYLVNLRLEKASELLKTGNYLVKDLAYSVGFNDELHFMKEFKRKFGVTVKQYYQKVNNLKAD